MELMKELGYERLAAQGGDWGADVTTLLGLRHPERVIAIHLNSVLSYKPYLEAGTVLSEVEQAFLNEASRWYEKSGAYDHRPIGCPLSAVAPQGREATVHAPSGGDTNSPN
jgi:pimeloyl-ACP methyl ester carboxylesterase